MKKFPIWVPVLILLAVYSFSVFYYNVWRMRVPTAILYAAAPGKEEGHPPALMHDDSVVWILSVDGGGIRGVLPLQILQHIEATTRRPIYKSFDMMAGTSTGALITTALSQPNHQGANAYSPTMLLQAYEHIGEKLLSAPWWHRLLTLGGVLGPMFPGQNIRDALPEYLDANGHFTDQLVPLLVPTYNVNTESLLMFRSWDRLAEQNVGVSPYQVVAAAVATPAIFPPTFLETKNKQKYLLIDAAGQAENPTMYALWEAMKMFPNKRYGIVSLGTGNVQTSFSREHATNWGMLEWVPIVMKDIVRGQRVGADHSVRQFRKRFPGILVAYYRFEPKVSNALSYPFSAGPEQVKALEAIGKQYIDDKRDVLNHLARQLVAQ